MNGRIESSCPRTDPVTEAVENNCDREVALFTCQKHLCMDEHLEAHVLRRSLAKFGSLSLQGNLSG